MFRVTGQGGNLTRTFDFTLWVATFDFMLTADPDNLSMLRGETATSTIRASLLAGDPATVELSGAWVDTEPTGVTATLSPTSGVPTFESTLTVSVATGAEGGSFLYRIIGSGGGKTSEIYVRITVDVGLALTLTTDKDNYEKGETIRISGTAKDPRGENVENGMAEIQFICEDLKFREENVRIENGVFSYDYPIWFGDPDGIWTIRVEAEDNLKNTGTVTIYITVGTPPGVEYFKITIHEPTMGSRYARGEVIRFSVEVKTEDDLPVENAEVFFISPLGVRGHFDPMVGALGVYTADYKVGWGDPLGSWVARITAEKGLKQGGAQTIVEIQAKPLVISLLSPSPGDQVEVGETVQIRVKVTYWNGDPVEGATVTVTMLAGENLTLVHEGAGIYVATYTFTSRDVGKGRLEITAFEGTLEAGMNLGSEAPPIEVARMGILRTLTTYWWATLSILVGAGVASGYLGRRAILVRKLKRVRKEIREIPKLKREAMIKYFKEGSIERDTYDELMDKYDMRLGELRKEEMRLSAKVGKKVRTKKARRRKRR